MVLPIAAVLVDTLQVVDDLDLGIHGEIQIGQELQRLVMRAEQHRLPVVADDLAELQRRFPQIASFIAVDHVVRNTNPARAPTVDQPSAMPEGVSNLAIGAEVPSTPEPSAWLAMLIVLGIVAATFSVRRRGA